MIREKNLDNLLFVVVQNNDNICILEYAAQVHVDKLNFNYEFLISYLPKFLFRTWTVSCFFVRLSRSALEAFEELCFDRILSFLHLKSKSNAKFVSTLKQNICFALLATHGLLI